MTNSETPPSERDLVAGTRAGSDAAWTALRQRHESAVAAVARRRGRHAAANTETAMESLRRELVEGDDDGRSARVRAVRPLAIAVLTGGDYGPTPPGTVPGTRSADRVDDVVDHRLATAFGRLPTLWQTVLWHRWVEREPAAALATPLERTPTEVVALEAVAAAGLFDRYLAVVLDEPDATPASCASIVPQLGGYVRNTLPAGERRTIDAHLAGGDACATHLAVAEQLEQRTPAAIGPGITGVTPSDYRAIVGVGVAAAGTAAVAADRTARRIRRARLVAAVGVIVALVGAAILIRNPFGDLDTEIADLLDRVSTTTTTSTPAAGGDPADGDPGDAEPSRIEMVFPGALQGIGYVPGPEPLALTSSLSMPAPPYAGGTATVDLAVTNTNGADPNIVFLLSMSAGVTFDELTEGDGDCELAADDRVSCRLRIATGATTAVSLRFALERELPDRLVVAPNIPSNVLDVEIVELDTLAVGTVERGRIVSGSGRFAECAPGADCSARSSVDLTWDESATVESATAVWSVAAVGASALEGPGGGSVPLAIDGEETDPVAVVDVTELVVESGPGRYTLERTSPSTEGSWSLLVVLAEPSGPRRVLVGLHPDVVVAPDEPFGAVVAVASPTGPPPSTDRPLEFGVDAERVPGAGLAVGGRPLVADDAVEVQEGAAQLYALAIGPDDDDLIIDASATVQSYRLSAVAFSLDILT